MNKVIIDPACNFYYSSYYIKGLFDVFGFRLKFSSKPFRHLHYTHDTHILAFVLINDKVGTNYVIDFADAPNIEKKFLEWCDIYGKVNFRNTIGYPPKVVPCAPNCALKIWRKPIAGIMALFNYLKCYSRTIDFYDYLSRYLMTCKRRKDFDNSEISNPNYMFLVGTLWKGQEKTNLSRINFIRACKTLNNIHFEGGLLPDYKDVENEFNDVLLVDSIDYDQYLIKTQQSAVVFNTPAYHLCHGWKLTEFLAMGKAIISTPFANELAVDLIHGENIYFVSEDKEEIKNAIIELTTNHSLRKKLEQGALDYYSKYIAPSQSIKQLLLNSKND